MFGATDRKIDKIRESGLKMYSTNEKLSFVEARDTNALAAVGKIRRGMSLHLISEGSFSHHNIIKAILPQIGPAACLMAVWSATTPGIQAIGSLIEQGLITSWRIVLDTSIQKKASEYTQQLLAIADEVKVRGIHCKISVFLASNWAISISSSANITNNPRTENYVITEGAETARFYADWIRRQLALGKEPLT